MIGEEDLFEEALRVLDGDDNCGDDRYVDTRTIELHKPGETPMEATIRCLQAANELGLQGLRIVGTRNAYTLGDRVTDVVVQKKHKDVDRLFALAVPSVFASEAIADTDAILPGFAEVTSAIAGAGTRLMLVPKRDHHDDLIHDHMRADDDGMPPPPEAA